MRRKVQVSMAQSEVQNNSRQNEIDYPKTHLGNFHTN